MEKQKNINGLVILVIALALLVLVLGGYIVYDKLLLNSNANIKPNNINSHTILENSDNIKINNKNLTSNDLNNVLDILGITKYDNGYNNIERYDNDNSCLNYYLSDNNFRNNRNFIFGWYTIIHQMGTNTAQNEKLIDYDNDGIADISPCGGAADCGSIKIENANKIVNLYKLTGMNEYFKEMPTPYKDKEYIIDYYNLIKLHPYSCNIVVKHDLTSKYTDDTNIEIVDNQKVTIYEELTELIENNIKSTTNQIVTYNLKKDSSNNYYLDTVNVQ